MFSALLLITLAFVPQSAGEGASEPQAAAAPAAAAQEVAAPAVTAFVGVNVVPMAGEATLADQTVIVRGDRIAEVGPAAAVAVPEGATVIDGHGRWLMPGL